MLHQSNFLRDEYMEHQQGPPLSGKEEYLQRQQKVLVTKMQGAVINWQAPEPPTLENESEVFLDFESDGLQWWAGDLPIGVGLYLPNAQRSYYLPWGHKGGGNLDEVTVRRWFERELRGKRITNIRTKFDAHLSRAWGIDLEAQGNTFGDVAHLAALLDDHRRTFSQSALAKDYLGIDGKVTSAHGFELDPSKFAEYPAGLVAPRAEGDVETVWRLQQAMWTLLTEQGLHRVRELEDAVIPAVVEMEANGSPLDVELLDDYCRRSEREVEDALWEIRQATGCDLATPHKRTDIVRIFNALHLEMPLDAETDKVTIADDALAAYDHPVILTLRRAIALASLRSKFLLKYQASVSRDGILRYELHQTPFQDDAEGKGGAVSGRFSSAAMSYYDTNGKLCSEGGNIQQVFGVKSQYDPKRSFNPTKDYIVKKLFKPASGQWFEADMMQVEFRRFVHYSNSEKLIQAYRDDPLTDYHALVHGLVLKYTGKDFQRTHIKNINFCSMYGGGLLKVALMVGEITEKVYHELRGIQEASGYAVVQNDPRVAKTRVLHETYHNMFPEVKRLLKQASHVAETRGHVHTILGRRARFSPGDRMYSALNRVIQGSAADDNKMALVDVHKNRHRLGFVPRQTVHDSICGDLLDPATLPEMARFLNEQRLPSKVEILWSSGCGPSWAEAK